MKTLGAAVLCGVNLTFLTLSHKSCPDYQGTFTLVNTVSMSHHFATFLKFLEPTVHEISFGVIPGSIYTDFLRIFVHGGDE